MRKEIIKELKNQSNFKRSFSSRIIFHTLKNLDIINNAKYVLSYMSLDYEVDTKELNDYLQDKLVLPKIDKDNLLTLKGNTLIENKYHILEPTIESSIIIDKEEIDVVIVPMVAFDEKKNRLGHGQGYYDRFLSNCKAYKIGIAYECQKKDNLLIKDNDIPMDIVVTEKKLYY